MPLSHIGFALLIVFLWGMHFPVIQAGLEFLPPWVMITLRVVGSALIFMPFVKFSWARFRQFWPFGLWVNFVLMLSLFLVVEATDAATAALIMNGYIILTVAVSWWFFHEKVRWFTILGMALAIAGLVFIYGAPNMTWWGMIISIPFLVSHVMRELTLRKIDKPTPFELMGYGMLCVVPLVVPYSLIFHADDWAALSWDHAGPIVGVWFYQVFVMGLAVVGWQWLLARNDLSQVVPINLAQPLFAVLGAVVFLGQDVSGPLAFGGLLVVLGVGLHVIFGQRQKQKTAAPDL